MTSELDLVGIDDDDIVATVCMWCKARLVLATQYLSNNRAEASETLPLGIYHEPLFLSRLLGGGLCFIA